MFSNNTRFNCEHSDSTDFSMKASDNLQPIAKPSSNLDIDGFSLSNNHQIKYAFKNPPTYSFRHNVMNNQGLLKNSVFTNNLFQCDPQVYQKYVSRYESFRTWSKSHPVRPEQLCRAGFVYTGEGDKVMCPWCKIKLIEWEPYDLPFEQYRRHSTSCDFLKMLMP